MLIEPASSLHTTQARVKFTLQIHSKRGHTQFNQLCCKLVSKTLSNNHLAGCWWLSQSRKLWFMRWVKIY